MKKLTVIGIVLIFSLPVRAQIFNPSDATVCKGGNTTFKSGSIYPAPSYQWQIKHRSNWYDLTNTAPFSGVTNATLTLTNVSDTFNADSFKCKVFFNSALVGISKAARLTVMGGSTVPSSASASVNPVSCPGGATQLSVNGGALSAGSSWKWYERICGKNAVSNSVNPDSTTTYYVRAEGSCGDTTACVSVTVVVTNKNSVAPKSISASRDTICTGQSAVLSVVGGSLGTGAKWKWYSGGTCAVVLDTQGNSAITVSPLTTNTYSVKADGKCGSTSCKSVTVTVNPLPVINAGKDTVVCKGASFRLNATANGNKNIYVWSPASGLNDTGVLKPIAKPLATITYILTVKDANKCVKSDTVKITVNKLPVAKASNDTAICKGGAAKLHASGGTSYQWNPATGLNFPNSANPFSTAQVNTKYKVTVTDANLCSDTAVVNIKVNPLPKINLTPDTAVCAGNSIRLHAEDGVTYNWSPANGLDANNIPEPVATPAVNTHYKVKVTNSQSCSVSDSVLVIVKQNPVFIPGPPLKVAMCLGDMVKLMTIDNPAADTYSWKPTATLTTPNQSSTLAFPKVTTTYTVERGINGCTTTDTIIVEVLNSPPPVMIRKDSVLCKNTAWAQYCISPSSHGFTWNVTNGTILSGQGTSCIEVFWSQWVSSGTVSVKDSVKGVPRSCPVNISFNITVNGGPAPTPVKVIAKGNNISSGILLSPNSPFALHEWGYESKITHAEQKTCTGDTFCLYSGGIDTLNFYYWVKVGNDKACLTKSYFNRMNFVNDIKQINDIQPIILYPNPVTDKLTIESSSEIQSIELFNIFGQKMNVPLYNGTNNLLSVDMTGLSAGIYFISIKTFDGIATRKIIKR